MRKGLLHGGEIDRRLSFRPGTAERLARRGTLPHIRLPNGAIRFRWKDVSQCLQEHNVAKKRQGGRDE